MNHTREYYQEKLNKLYDSIPRIYPSSLPSNKKISGPLLISPTAEYATSSKRVIIVGQETYGWDYGYKDFCLGGKSVTDFLDLYDRFDFGFRQKGERKYNSPFWNEFRRIEKDVFGTDHRTILWQNLVKFDYAGGSVFKAPEETREKLLELSRDLFLQELEILEPDIVVFFTGVNTQYDQVIKEWYTGVSFEDLPSSIFPGKKGDLVAVHRVTLPQPPSLSIRTYHPRFMYSQGSQFRQKVIEQVVQILRDHNDARQL